MIINYFNYYNPLKRGVRITLRSKVNDNILTGLRLVDSLLPLGRGQRQLILGDRYTGKTSIFISIIFSCNFINIIGGVDGIGTKQLIRLYLGININLRKLNNIINIIIFIN